MGGIYFIDKFKLYRSDFKNKISSINHKNFKVIDLIPIENGKKLICLGELFNQNNFYFGFIVLNVVTSKIEIAKTIEVYEVSKFSEKFLQYSGDFNSYKTNCYSYSCDKYSKVYFFDSKGFLTKELNTIDKLELPGVLTNSKGISFYNRKNTFNSNEGLLVIDNSIFILSSFHEFKSNIIIDIYDYNNLKYKNSLKLNCNNLGSINIRNVLFKNNKLVIALDHIYASFIFSRHI